MDRRENLLEYQIGQYWFAKLGTVVLLFGRSVILFSYLYNKNTIIFSCCLNYFQSVIIVSNGFCMKRWHFEALHFQLTVIFIYIYNFHLTTYYPMIYSLCCKAFFFIFPIFFYYKFYRVFDNFLQ